MVTLEGNPIRIQGRIQRVLFYFLACQNDLVSRPDLVMLFWPEEGETDGRRHLRETLSKLRAQIPDDALYFRHYDDQIGLNFENIYVDVREFRQIHALNRNSSLRTPNHVPLPEPAARDLEKGVGMWRSAHFMAGASMPPSVELDRWFMNTAEELEWSRMRDLERLGYHAGALGDLEAGLSYHKLALEYNEMNEPIQHQMLSWLRDLGRRSDVLSYYVSLQALYQREEGGPPPPSLHEFYKKIRAEASLPPQTSRQVWPLNVSLHTPFVGRNHAMKELRQAYQRGGTAVIYGEAGSGKTRLVYEFFQSIEPAPRLLIAQARAQESVLPFQPLLEMLRNYVQPEDWRSLNPIWIASLLPLLPELSGYVPKNPASEQRDLSEARAQVFEALRQLLLVLSASQRVFIFLDDAQWCDQATLDAMAYIQDRHFFANRGLFVLAARMEENNDSLEKFLNRPQIRTTLTWISLLLLQHTEIAEIARYLSGQQPSPALVDRLVHDTGGNPLFVIEMLSAWLEFSPSIDLNHSVEQLPFASSIVTLLRERIRNFSVRKRDVLATAAVIGHEFDLDLLEAATDLTSDQLVVVMESLEHSRLIRPLQRSTGVPGYTFVHAVVREVLLSGLSLARNRNLHLKVAEALHKQRAGLPGKNAFVLAGHYEAAGQAEKAFSYWLEAASYALQLLSTSDAVAAYRHAEQIFQATGQQLDDISVYRLYREWGELAGNLNDLETMERVYITLSRCGEQRGSRFLVGSGLSGLCNAYSLMEKRQLALDTIEQAILYLESCSDRYEIMSAYNRKGWALRNLDRYQEAVEIYQKTIDLGQGSDDPKILQAKINAEDALAFMYIITGWPKKTRDLSEQILAERRYSLNYAGQSRTYSNLGLAYFYCGQYQQAIEYCRLGIEWAENAGNSRWIGALNMTMARANLAHGHLDECWAHLDKAAAIGRRLNNSNTLADSFAARGDFASILSCYDEAMESYRQAESFRPENHILARAMIRLGITMAFKGQVNEARDILQNAIELTDRIGIGTMNILARVCMAQIHMSLGEPIEMEYIIQLVAEARERGLGTMPLISKRMLVELYMRSGQYEDAWELVQSSIEVSRSFPNPFDEMNSLRTGLRVLQMLNHPTEPLCERAKEILTEMEKHARLPEVRQYFDCYRKVISRDFSL